MILYKLRALLYRLTHHRPEWTPADDQRWGCTHRARTGAGLCGTKRGWQHHA